MAKGQYITQQFRKILALRIMNLGDGQCLKNGHLKAVENDDDGDGDSAVDDDDSELSHEPYILNSIYTNLNAQTSFETAVIFHLALIPEMNAHFLQLSFYPNSLYKHSKIRAISEISGSPLLNHRFCDYRKKHQIPPEHANHDKLT